MRFVPTALQGVTIIELDAIEDNRGFFARTFCDEEFKRAGIFMQVRQTNISHNRRAFTLRGLHYQAEPYAEPKVVQCVRGRIWDVAVDLRPESQTYCQWAGMELSPRERRLYYIPRGCAHGFLTLEPNSDVVYLMGAPYVAESTRGVRWNDSAFGIEWPAQPVEMSERDAGYSDF
jgi:dTDP-4-dehydrorhamnose 3,5-epimerase